MPLVMGKSRVLTLMFTLKMKILFGYPLHLLGIATWRKIYYLCVVSWRNLLITFLFIGFCVVSLGAPYLLFSIIIWPFGIHFSWTFHPQVHFLVKAKYFAVCCLWPLLGTFGRREIEDFLKEKASLLVWSWQG